MSARLAALAMSMALALAPATAVAQSRDAAPAQSPVQSASPAPSESPPESRVPAPAQPPDQVRVRAPAEVEAPAAARAPAEEVVAALSQNQVSITTTYSGSEIFVFGAVKRQAPPADARLDVVVAVDGPSAPVLVRRKARMFGIWANADAALIDEAPSFYAVSATGPLEEVVSATDDLRHRIGVGAQVRVVGLDASVSPEDRDLFREAVIRLRREKGLYLETEERVSVIDGALFTARFALPANLVEGDYRARVFLLHDRAVVDVFETSIAVRKAGMERFLHGLSREAPLIYGLLSIAVALAAGWAASEAFRLLRR